MIYASKSDQTLWIEFELTSSFLGNEKAFKSCASQKVEKTRFTVYCQLEFRSILENTNRIFYKM